MYMSSLSCRSSDSRILFALGTCYDELGQHTEAKKVDPCWLLCRCG